MPEETTKPIRPNRRTRQTSSKPRARTAAPPNRVEPGWIHRKLATTILRLIQERSASKLGTPISVGTLPTPDPENGVIAGDDTREPVELLARVFAHIAHRIPGLKKIEKRFEGNDNRSGLGSDLFALASQLLSRNEEIAYGVAESVAGEALKGVIKKPVQKEEPVNTYWPQEEGKG